MHKDLGNHCLAAPLTTVISQMMPEWLPSLLAGCERSWWSWGQGCFNGPCLPSGGSGGDTPPLTPFSPNQGGCSGSESQRCLKEHMCLTWIQRCAVAPRKGSCRGNLESRAIEGPHESILIQNLPRLGVRTFLICSACQLPSMRCRCNSRMSSSMPGKSCTLKAPKKICELACPHSHVVLTVMGIWPCAPRELSDALQKNSHYEKFHISIDCGGGHTTLLTC